MEQFSLNADQNESEKRIILIKSLVMIILFALLLASLFAALLLREEKEYSDAERRPLESAPDFTYQQVANGKYFDDFEDYALDQFVLRDFFRSIKAMGSYYLLGKYDNNDLYYYRGGLYKIERLNAESFAAGGEKIETLAKKYEGMNCFYALIPDKNSLVAAHSGRPYATVSYMEAILEETVTSAEYVDITELLSETHYYATDLHWRQEKIKAVADHLLLSMGNDYRVLQDSFSEKTLSGFFGGYYDQAALPIGGEDLIYLESQTLSQVIVTDLSTGSTIPLYSEDAFSGVDPYNLFLGGPQPLLRIENPNAKADKKLYLFRDSFGSSLAPLLVGGYSEIYLIDLRYVMSDYLDFFMTFEKGNDMLFLYSTQVLNQSAILK